MTTSVTKKAPAPALTDFSRVGHLRIIYKDWGADDHFHGTSLTECHFCGKHREIRTSLLRSGKVHRCIYCHGLGPAAQPAATVTDNDKKLDALLDRVFVLTISTEEEQEG